MFASLTVFAAEQIAHADEPAPKDCLNRPNAIVADLGLHVIALGYQRQVACHVVLQSSAGLYGPWTVNSNVLGLGAGRKPDGDVIGFMVRGRAFLFAFHDGPNGFWISPYVQGGPVTATVNAKKELGPAFATGLSAGWTFSLGERVLLGLGLGGQYHRSSFGGSVKPPGFSLFGPTVDINLAVRF